jgi:hypothetical protein
MLLVLLLAGCSGGTSGKESEGAPGPTEPTIQAPVMEPTVQDPTPQGPAELREAQRELDAQCAQIDIQEAQKMGMPPEKYGCEADGTGIPVQEWIDQGKR